MFFFSFSQDRRRERGGGIDHMMRPTAAGAARWAASGINHCQPKPEPHLEAWTRRLQFVHTAMGHKLKERTIGKSGDAERLGSAVKAWINRRGSVRTASSNERAMAYPAGIVVCSFVCAAAHSKNRGERRIQMVFFFSLRTDGGGLSC